MKQVTIFASCILMICQLNAQDYMVGDHELLIMPTAYTMEAGDSYLTNYELFFLNYTYAVTSSTHLGIFTLFPITSEFLKTITFGLKQKYIDGDFINAALWSSYTPKVSGFTGGTVFSFGSSSHGFHAGVGAASTFDDPDDESDQSSTDKWEFLFLAGYSIDLSKKIALLVEYTNAQSGLENDFQGLISFGIRFKGESISWDLAGIRPIQGTGDADLVLFPLVKATFLF